MTSKYIHIESEDGKCTNDGHPHATTSDFSRGPDRRREEEKKRMEKTTRNDIEFKRVLTTESQYGIMWVCINKKLNCKCIVKQIMLRTRAHYDQDKSQYVNEKGKKDKTVTQYFKQDAEQPFLHTLFLKRKSLTLDLFKLEVHNAKRLAKLGVGVKVFCAWIQKSADVPIDYGFMATERGEWTIKDLIVKDLWTEDDKQIVYKLIQTLHKNNVIHRDLKPSNIVVWLKNGHITRARFIDFQKVRTLDDLGAKEFKKKLKKELPHFEDHVKKNQKERVLEKKK